MKTSNKAVLTVGALIIGASSSVFAESPAQLPKRNEAIAKMLLELNEAQALQMNDQGQIVIAPALLDELRASGLVSEIYGRSGSWTPDNEK